MGESIVDFVHDVEKVGETAASNSSHPGLEVSVSFGRFENDSLSWEKWSTFSPIKYLEEVEKCATPGSVAQKRAYFEAHYKKIAARKAEEQLEQERQMQDDPFIRSEDQKGGDQIDCGTHFEIDLTNSQSNAQGSNQDSSHLEKELSSSPHVDDLLEDDVFTIEFHSSLPEGEKEETDSGPPSPALSKPDEPVLVKEVEDIPADSQERPEISKTLDNDVGNAPEVKEDNEKPRLGLQKGSQKVTPVSKERNVATVKKKPVPSITKTPQKSTPSVSKPISTSTPRVSKSLLTSTPRVSKSLSTSAPRVSKSVSTSTPRVSKSVSTSTPRVSKVSKSVSTSTPRVSKSVSTSTATPASRSSVKKSNSSSLPRSKNPSAEETKKVPPKSMHMSLSLDPTKSDSPSETTASVTTTRKSFIMENMGDKEIVKRAFKTFQNNFNQPKSSSEEKSSTPKQLSSKGKELRVSTSEPLPKENGGPLKTGALEKRTAKAAPSSLGLRRDEKGEKGKEFSKKLEAKSNVKEAERMHFQPKSKDQKEAEIKKFRQNLNVKAAPTPGLSRGEKNCEIVFQK